MAIYGSLGEVDLGALDASISDTAVDIFVYDTRKDSDGGAWRKRTQHTSWYNETLNTATRGSRREFPAVAVIVAEAYQVTIYDGDDPDLPMWMVFEVGRTPTVRVLNWYTSGTASISSVFQLNSKLCIGTLGGVTIFDFASDDTRLSYQNVNYEVVPKTISTRNNLSTVFSGGNGYNIIQPTINDVTMTVLPNAPIDSTTGLPIPTIAVATDGGVSVIKDDGTVVNYTRGASNEYTGSVAFDQLNDLIISWGTSPGGYRHATRITNPFVGSTSLDTTYGYIASDLGMGGSAAGNVGGVVTVANSGRHFGIDFDSSSGVPATQNNHDDRVNFLHINDADTTKSLVAYATTSYNTGWMHGNIKGAFLSDTTVESLTAGTNLATGFTFKNTNRLVSHTYDDGDTSWQMVDDVGTIAGFVELYMPNLTAGKSYIVSMTVDNHSTFADGAPYISRVSHNSGANTYFNHWDITSASAITLTGSFIAETNSNDELTIYASDITMNVTNLSVREVEDQDRSVKNKGLQVYGTVTKSPVAGSGDTAAELVAYSGFSIPNDVASTITNGLIQPYNTSLSGTTFVFSGWFKTSDNPDYQYTVQISDTTGSSHSIGGLSIYTNNSGGNSGLPYMWSHTGGNGASAIFSGSRVDDNVWHHFVAIYNTNSKTLYVDGVSRGTQAANTISSFSGAEVYIGMHRQVYSGGDYNYRHAMRGSLALIRVGTTIPSPEQIKKIYEDEKVLFQENAACTLYGSSDAVTALAYDEDLQLLHVGTSSGRSDFQGLRRINNTTTAVATAISASNGLVAEQ